MTARRVFISYSRRDRDVVKPLSGLLKLGGAEVFRDEESIEPGEEWAKVLVSNIQSCDRIALFWSANAAASEQVTAEWMLGLHHQKPVAPLLLDDTPVPQDLAKFQFLDCRAAVTVKPVSTPVKKPTPAVSQARTLDRWKGYLPYLSILGMAAPPLLPLLPVYLALSNDEDARRKLAERAKTVFA